MSLIVVVADSLRADALGCRAAPPRARDDPHYLELPAATPTLDRLAAEGVAFDRVIAAAPWTVPAIASLLTGIYSHRLGLARWEQPLSAEYPTLFHHAAAAGAEVASFVFDPAFLFRRLPEARVRGSSQDVAALLDWVTEHRHEEYFLFVHYWWTHVPYVQKPLGTRAWRLLTDQVLAGLRSGPAAREGIKGLYRRAVTSFSEDFLPRLLERAELDRTWVVVTADHGESWGEREETAALGDVFDLHGHTLYDEALRIPLLVRPPGGGDGHRVGGLVRSVDLAPTLTSLLGWRTPGPEDADGVDLSASVLGAEPPPPLDALSVMNRDFVDSPHLPEDPADLYHGYSLTTPRYKLLHEPRTGRHRAFLLDDDPGELRDVSAAPAHRAALAPGWERLARERERARVGEWLERDALALRERLRDLGYVE